jgi:glucosyl-3-phosphoglycerate phosphatase
VTARRVLLWRHGRTAWNVEHRFQGQADPPLDEVGHTRSAVAAAMLATFGPVAVVSSDLVRAVETAWPLADRLGLPVTLDPRLRERSLGRWEGLTRDEVGRLYPQEYVDWLAGREDCQAGSEPRSVLADRALAALADTVGETVVLVTHSATAIALTGRLLGLPVQTWRAVGPLANCHWSELGQDDHGWRLRSHNVGPAGPVVPGTEGADLAGLLAPNGATGAGCGDELAADADALDAGPPAGARAH